MEMMGLVIVAIILVAILLMLVSNGGGKNLPVEAKPLLTKREREALAAIEAALPQHRVFPQVAMGAVMRPKRRLPAKKRASVRNRFAQKIVDFVAEHRSTGELLLIEVDDTTHNAAKDKQRDAITAAAGYRTVRIPAKARPTAELVRELVNGSSSRGVDVALNPAPVESKQRRRRIAVGA